MKHSKVFRRILGILVLLPIIWSGASIAEMSNRERILPLNPYAFCGNSKPQTLPDTVRIGFYEEFPNPFRLAKLRFIDFPISLAIAASSREEFDAMSKTIKSRYPMVHTVYYWPILSYEEGYYPGSWSDTRAIQRATNNAAGIPTLWDLEMPLGFRSLDELSVENWWKNKPYLENWLRSRNEPVHIWRSHPDMGINPWFMIFVGMQFDPDEYPLVKLHLDLYHIGKGFKTDEMRRMLRCGIEKYHDRFIPSFGVLNDGEGPPSYFIPDERLQRDLTLARQEGAMEVWLFGVNGLTKERARMIRQILVNPQDDTAGGN